MRAYRLNEELSNQLTLHRLSNQDTTMIQQAAIWAEAQWGYVLNFAGLANRIRLIKDLTIAPHRFYFLTFGDKPAGMFALRSYANRTICSELSKLKHVAELDYVYTDKSLRGSGIGGQIIEFAKREAKAAGIQHITLDTLDPSLNPFYIQHGAVFASKSQYHGFATDKLLINL